MSASLLIALCALAGGQDRCPWPVDGGPGDIVIGQDYGTAQDHEPIGLHQGIDLVLDCRAPVYAAEAGEVILVTDLLPRQGGVVVESPAGRSIRYLHLARRSIQFSVGDQVEEGDLLGRVAPWSERWPHFTHLHIEIGEGHLAARKKKRSGEVEVLPKFRATDNPRDAFEVLPDSHAPVIGKASVYGPLRFDLEDGGEDLPYDAITEPFEVILDVSDRMDADDHVLPPYGIRIEVLQEGRVVEMRQLILDGPLGTPIKAEKSIAADRTLAGSRPSFRSLGWNDKSSTSIPGKVARPFDLDPGEYRVRATAWDYAGNESVPVEVTIHVRS